MQSDMQRAVLTSLLVVLFLSLASFSQVVPRKPIQTAICFPPGGTTNLLAKPWAEQLGRKLGQSAIIENRPGANTINSTESVARATPDGHALLIANPSVPASGNKELATWVVFEQSQSKGYPELELKYWCGLFAPPGTQNVVITKLHSAFAAIAQDHEMQKRLRTLNAEPRSRHSRSCSGPLGCIGPSDGRNRQVGRL